MLIRSCKEALWAAKKESKEADQRIWTSRVERLGVLLAGLFAEVKVRLQASVRSRRADPVATFRPRPPPPPFFPPPLLLLPPCSLRYAASVFQQAK